MVYSSFESSYYMSITFALTCNLEKLEYGEQLDYTKLFSLLYIYIHAYSFLISLSIILMCYFILYKARDVSPTSYPLINLNGWLNQRLVFVNYSTFHRLRYHHFPYYNEHSWSSWGINPYFQSHVETQKISIFPFSIAGGSHHIQSHSWAMQVMDQMKYNISSPELRDLETEAAVRAERQSP